MRSAFVVDASVAVAWVHPAQATSHTDALLDAVADGGILEVPSLWPLEVANALLVLMRRGKLRDEERRLALQWLQGLRLKVDHDAVGLAFSQLSVLAEAHDLSLHDAAYLELAHRKKLPLACKDGALRAAAKRAGVDLLSS